MSRDFNKEDSQKGAEKEICNHCGTEEGTFTLIQDKLNETFKTGVQRLHLDLRRKPDIDSLIGTLKKNIFSSIDKIGEDIINGQSNWKSRLQNVSGKRVSHRHSSVPASQEQNEGLLEVMHFLGDKIHYNTLLFSLPSLWDEQLNEFYKMVFFGTGQNINIVIEDFNNYLKGIVDQKSLLITKKIPPKDWNLFTDLSEEAAISFIQEMISNQIHHLQIHDNARENIKETARSIYTSLSERGIRTSGNWEENYAKNSPLSVLTPRLLSSQFSANEVFEGVKYCDYCGAEQSRSLMYSGLFIPFSGEENKENEVVHFFGRIQDIESEVLPLIQGLWGEQVEEYIHRDKKATKMWDGAEGRLIKKQEKEKERKRQAEIAKLEKKLKAIKNNDESDID